MNEIRPPIGRARRCGAALLALVLVAALGACGGGGGDDGGNAGSDVKADVTLEVTGFSYKDVTVPAGGTLAVKNSSGATHTFTPDHAGDFEDKTYGDGETITIKVPDQPGQYGFHCEIHPNMQATLTVE